MRDRKGLRFQGIVLDHLDVRVAAGRHLSEERRGSLTQDFKRCRPGHELFDDLFGQGRSLAPAIQVFQVELFLFELRMERGGEPSRRPSRRLDSRWAFSHTMI